MPTRARAFLRQARSDLRIYRMLAEAGVPQCHVMQSLQMAGEKLGKAMRLSAGQAGAEEHTHVAAARALRLIRNRRAAADALTGGDRQRLTFTVDACIALANDIERLTPGLAGAGPNLEYPWRDSDFPFGLARRMRGGEGQRYVALLDRIMSGSTRSSGWRAIPDYATSRTAGVGSGTRPCGFAAAAWAGSPCHGALKSGRGGAQGRGMIPRIASRLVDAAAVFGVFLALDALELTSGGLEVAPVWAGGALLALGVSHVMQTEARGVARRIRPARVRLPRVRLPRVQIARSGRGAAAATTARAA